MERRSFFKNSSLAALGIGLSPTIGGCESIIEEENLQKKAKNIIFLVSDGMSSGTLTMTDYLSSRKQGYHSHWMSLYHENRAKRALMETSSANSIVTDSAAASSSWGCGVRVPNGRLNVGANDEHYEPILQKFKNAGKAVGCVTSVPITHATPAGFCVNNISRGNQAEIAKQYLDLRFDVMLGGGKEYFDASLRKDGEDVYGQFAAQGYTVAREKAELSQIHDLSKPVIGAFCESGIPYALDHEQSEEEKKTIPTLPEMTRFAIEKMSTHNDGFVLQIEGGKVDWAAHGNDIGGLLYDQLAFDECVKIAQDFAAKNDDTLVIVTTDHGNANPGLFYGKEANQRFDQLQEIKHTNRWVLTGIEKTSSVASIIERVEHAQGIVLSREDAALIFKHYQNLPQLEADNTYNDYALPFKKLAEIQNKHFNVGWAGMHHSADFVELAMTGAGSEMLPAFVKNTDLHNFMLVATGVLGVK